jgi:hypothetical protein
VRRAGAEHVLSPDFADVPDQAVLIFLETLNLVTGAERGVTRDTAFAIGAKGPVILRRLNAVAPTEWGASLILVVRSVGGTTVVMEGM